MFPPQGKFSIICAMDLHFGIAKNGVIPWHSKQDLQFFKNITSGTSTQKNAILMGRKTWDSLPKKPLPNRYNIILTSNPHYFTPLAQNNVLFFSNWEQALSWSIQHACHVFVIGGRQIYQIALKNPLLFAVYLTIVNKSFDCNLFFPWDPRKFILQETLQSWQSDLLTYSIQKYFPNSF